MYNLEDAMSDSQRTVDATLGDFSVLIRLLGKRHSCRAFLPEPVSRATIEQILEAARHTASWCNAQPWQVDITSGAATETLRSALYSYAASGEYPPSHDFSVPERYVGQYLLRRRACGLALYRSVGVARDDKAAARRQALENFRFFGAPHAAFISTAADLGTYGAIDCGGFVSTFLLVAESLGIAAIPQAALASHPELIRRQLKLPARRRIVCGISFGYEDRSHPANSFRTDRAPLQDTVVWHEDEEIVM
jgi:nitroreductase